MKIIYSHLKKLLPDLTATPRTVANDLTMIGHFADSFEEKDNEQIISLEIRQNRGDCLGYYGIAKELSVLYDIPIKLPQLQLPSSKTKHNLPIEVAANDQVKRLMAIKISHLKNSASPQWLERFLQWHDINSLNTLVDLTNYIMLWYGIPCHAFDTKKSTENLIWEINNHQYDQMTTFDGSIVKLKPDTLVISNSKKPVSLTFIGGQNSGISLNTKETIVEMAIYDRVRVGKDSREFKITTEAGIRLDKELDCELIPQAFSHLIKLILKYGQGKITSNLYEYYPHKTKRPAIRFDSRKPAAFAGINIKPSFAIKTLKKLGCSLSSNSRHSKEYLVTPPSLRKDISLEEDLIEEVIRFYGYDKIPSDQPISFKKLPDITPKILYLIEAVRGILVKLGYDEVRSWPLIKKRHLLRNRELGNKAKPIYTENNINANFPVLRMSIISSLLTQKNQYERYKVSPMQFFEIGKVFYQLDKNYREHYSLGVYHHSAKKLERDSKLLGKRLEAKIRNSLVKIKGNLFLELNLEKLLKENPRINLPKFKITTSNEATCELTRQIITLDANVSFTKKQNPAQLIKKYTKIIGKKYLWQLVISDLYQNRTTHRYKYTFRASYFNIDNKMAKEIHFRAFKLEKE